MRRSGTERLFQMARAAERDFGDEKKNREALKGYN